MTRMKQMWQATGKLQASYVHVASQKQAKSNLKASWKQAKSKLMSGREPGAPRLPGNRDPGGEAQGTAPDPKEGRNIAPIPLHRISKNPLRQSLIGEKRC